MEIDGPVRVEVAWGSADDDALLRRLVARGLGVSADELTEVRVCPACGASDHGRPFVRRRSASAGWVSLSRHEDVAVVAWSPHTPVGVDVEAAGRDRDAWVHREARGKADGSGITGPDPVGITTRLLDAPAGCVAALAVDAPEPWDVVIT